MSVPSMKRTRCKITKCKLFSHLNIWDRVSHVRWKPRGFPDRSASKPLCAALGKTPRQNIWKEIVQGKITSQIWHVLS